MYSLLFSPLSNFSLHVDPLLLLHLSPFPGTHLHYFALPFSSTFFSSSTSLLHFLFLPLPSFNSHLSLSFTRKLKEGKHVSSKPASFFVFISVTCRLRCHFKPCPPSLLSLYPSLGLSQFLHSSSDPLIKLSSLRFQCICHTTPRLSLSLCFSSWEHRLFLAPCHSSRLL